MFFLEDWDKYHGQNELKRAAVLAVKVLNLPAINACRYVDLLTGGTGAAEQHA